MSYRSRSDMLGKMEVRRLLIKLAIPATIAMLANALYNLVDTIFVARWVDEIAIGALAIVFPIQMIVMAIGLMIGMGSASIFSRAYGRGDRDSMTKSVNTALFLNLIVSVAISLTGLIFIEQLLTLFGATEENIEYTRQYLGVILIGLIPFSLAIVLNNLSRAEGRANVAMVSLLIGAVVNIALDPFFIRGIGFIPEMGVQGAAVATLIAKSASFIYVFSMAMQKRSELNIRLKTIHKLDLKMTGEILAIGLPTFVRNTLGAVLAVAVNHMINFHAPADIGPGIYISIYGVINRMIMFLLLPGLGLVQGLIPIVGFNFGARFHERLYDVIKFATRLIVAYFALMFAFTLISAELLFVIFSRDEDALFITEGARAFRIISVGFTMIGFQVILSSVYQAMGYPVRALLVGLSRQFLLFMPLLFLLTHFFALDGIWITFLSADLLAGSICLLVYILEMKDLRRKFITVPEPSNA